MKIIMMNVGMIETNCYIAFCEKSMEGVVIDPGDNAQSILKAIKDNGIKVKYIINTHGHMDHIGANMEVKEKTNAELLIHELDAEMLINTRRSLADFMNKDFKTVGADKIMKEGDVISFGEESLKVIHVPGHTLGGVALYNEKNNICFTGDTLFYGSIGRTDLPGGDFNTIIKSIKNKLFILPDKTIVLPGHGPDSTIAQEKRINPFVR